VKKRNESITMNQDYEGFEQARPYYKYRCPYISEIFIELSKKLYFNRDQNALDLGCGSGEIAEKISPYFKEVTGIDFSKSMLADAKSLENVTYIQHDFSDLFRSKISYDFIFLGRSIPYVPNIFLKHLIDNHFSPSGKILVLGANFHHSTKWINEYHMIKKSYLDFSVDSREGVSDWQGLSIMKELNYKPMETLNFVQNMTISIKALENQYLSFHNLYGGIMKDRERFSSDVHNMMKPFLIDGFLHGYLHSWANIFERL